MNISVIARKEIVKNICPYNVVIKMNIFFQTLSDFDFVDFCPIN